MNQMRRKSHHYFFERNEKSWIEKSSENKFLYDILE